MTRIDDKNETIKGETLGHLLYVDPAKAKRVILAALRKANCLKSKAAIDLGIGHNTMLRWIDRLNLKDDIDRLLQQAEREGWRDRGNKPGRKVVLTPSQRVAKQRELNQRRPKKRAAVKKHVARSRS